MLFFKVHKIIAKFLPLAGGAFAAIIGSTGNADWLLGHDFGLFVRQKRSTSCLWITLLAGWFLQFRFFVS